MYLSWYYRGVLACATFSNTRASSPTVRLGTNKIIYIWLLSLSRHQSYLSPLRVTLLHHRNCSEWQWVNQFRDRPPICGTDGQVFRQCVRAWHYIWIQKGILHPKWASFGWWDAGKQQEEHLKVYTLARQPWRHGSELFPFYFVVFFIPSPLPWPFLSV